MPESKPARGVTVLRAIHPGPLVVRMDGVRKHTYYLIRELSGCAGSGRVYAVARFGATFAYTARTLPELSCECPAHYTRGRCIHTAMLIALERERRI